MTINDIELALMKLMIDYPLKFMLLAIEIVNNTAEKLESIPDCRLIRSFQIIFDTRPYLFAP